MKRESIGDKYKPNGSKESVKIGILHSVDGYYVSNEGTKKAPSFHVWIPDRTCCVCDSAYDEISLAVCRCNFLAKYAKTSIIGSAEKYQSGRLNQIRTKAKE